MDGNYLEATVKTNPSENEDARISAAITSATGLLLELEGKKDPGFKPGGNSTTLAVMKMSEGTMDVSVVHREFIFTFITLSSVS